MRSNSFLRALVVAVTVILAAGIPARSSAFSDAKNLTGANDFEIVADVTKPGCGPTEDDTKASIKSILSSSPRIRTLAQGTSAVYVSVHVLAGCEAASITLEVDSPVRITASGRSALATIWGSHGAMLGGSADMRRRVLDAVETLAKQLAADWNSAN
jgi:hypothetical protein